MRLQVPYTGMVYYVEHHPPLRAQFSKLDVLTATRMPAQNLQRWKHLVEGCPRKFWYLAPSSFRRNGALKIGPLSKTQRIEYLLISVAYTSNLVLSYIQEKITK